MNITISKLGKLADISSNYDGILSDIWGVVHNGLIPNEQAVAALVKYRASGGRVVLVTNASRTYDYVKKMLDEMGVNEKAYDAIVSSGDVTRKYIARYKGEIVHHVGPPYDHPVFAGLGIIKGEAKNAKVIVTTGLYNDDDSLEIYEKHLQQWRELELPMICTNPDKVVEIGNKLYYCAGALADLYLQMGGEVILAGKPNSPIYMAAFAEFKRVNDKEIPHNKILAIGDSVRTDAIGAAKHNLDFLFISGSIHAKEISASNLIEAEMIGELVSPAKANVIGYQVILK